MTPEQEIDRLKRALHVLANNLYGDGLDSMRPMSAKMCWELGQFAEAIALGERNSHVERFERNLPQELRLFINGDNHDQALR
jgi:hypothetical protein